MPLKGIKKANCMSCEQAPVLSRGQCSACYRHFKKLVDSGETTWATLVRKRLARNSLPSGKRSRAVVAMEKRRDSKNARTKQDEG
jgi:predicted ATP-dependent serine protease